MKISNENNGYSFWSILFGLNDDELKKIENNFSVIANSYLKFQSNIEKIALQIREFTKEHQKLIHEIAQIANDPKILDKYFGDYSNEIHKKLQAHGYFVSLSNFNIGETKKLSKLLDENIYNEIENFLCGRLRQRKTYNSISTRWLTNSAFNERSKILLRGLKAHFDGDFIASIPILIPQIEGILFDFFVNTSLLNNIPQRFQGTDALTELKKITIDEIFLEIDRIQFRRFIDRTKFYEFTNTQNGLNRGKILHGMCLDYNREDWSAKIIYLIDFLNNLTKNKWLIEEDSNNKYILKRVRD